MSRSPDGSTLQIKAEAAAWLARLHADNRSTADERGFQAWLHECPAHAAAFDAATTVWEAADMAAAPRTAEARARTLFVERRAVLCGVGALVAVGTTFSFWRSAYAGVYETDVGEQKHVVLNDGSYAFLDTDTRIQVDFDAVVRNVNLQRGRVNFRVAPDPRRPFVVDAADRRILASLSDFDIKRIGNELSVVLVQGTATVESGTKRISRTQLLKAGDRLI